MPLEDLWTAEGTLNAHRVNYLKKPELVQLLTNGSTFVVADVGRPLVWIQPADRFEFWKKEVSLRLANPDARIYLDDYPGAYCYFASMWLSSRSMPLIVLEKHH
jgi:hypothetical protein